MKQAVQGFQKKPALPVILPKFIAEQIKQILTRSQNPDLLRFVIWFRFL
jgi:hypothetical protein